MEQFDKLIKEKAEKREFKYKPLFWLLFAKHAGFMAFSAIHIVVGVAFVGGLAGGGVYVAHKLTHKNFQQPIQQVNTQITIKDTSSNISSKIIGDQDTIAFPIETSTPEKAKAQRQKIVKQTVNQNNKTNPKKVDSVSNPIVKPHNPYEGMRILTIDPDTILSNE